MSVTKKDGKWIAKGTVIRSDKSKAYYNKQFSTKREATAWEAKRREELQFENPSMTFAALVEIVNERDARRIKETSVKQKQGDYKNHMAEPFGPTKISAITTPIVERWYHSLLDAGYKLNSANCILSEFSSYLSEAVRMDLIPANPCFKIRKIKKDPDAVRNDEDGNAAENYWTPEEFQAFVPQMPDRHKDELKILWSTGMRIGEASALQWKHFKGDRLEIEQQKSHRTGKITSPKSKNGRRTVYLDPESIRILENRKNRFEKIEGFNEGWYIFGNWKPACEATFQIAFRKAVRKSGLKYITVHGLRHSHASFLICKGVPDIAVADRLGDTVAMIHKVYAHVYDQLKREVACDLAGIL